MTRINAGIPNQLTNNKNKVMKEYTVIVVISLNDMPVEKVTTIEGRNELDARNSAMIFFKNQGHLVISSRIAQ